jgi:Icc-related predicted phosphoesterase
MKKTPSRLFFASDLHGSDLCFRKFIRAASFYGAQKAILGGDLSGKALVTILSKRNGHYLALGPQGEVQLTTEREVTEYEELLAKLGLYSFRCEAVPEDRASRDNIFRQEIRGQLQRWVSLIDQEKKRSGTEFYWMPGNDDPPDIEDILEGSCSVENIDRKTFHLTDELSALGLGCSTPTPWHTPRELGEMEIADRLGTLAAKLQNTRDSIFVVHVPPFNSGLDSAPSLDKDLRIRYGAGGVLTAPVGSSSVRDAIQLHEPLLALSGHVHESQGATKIGRTTCINPGSIYWTGMLRGVIVTLSGTSLSDFQFVEG